MKCVHLDFHTSPDIENIGGLFNKEEFAQTLKDAHIDLITVFAKCHHGYCYYPTKIGEMHPKLNFNLLNEQIEAAHSVGVKAPIYITMGWSKKDADEHPEWHQINFWTKKPYYYGTEPGGDIDEPIKNCTWTTLCPSGGYLDYLKEITHEVCQQFDVSDGVFYDICFIGDTCVCDSCKAGMKEMGLDSDNIDDVREYYKIKHIEMMKTLTGIVQSHKKNAPVFYNGGADMNRPEYHPYQTHYELEDLPTAWGGYDLMPLRAKYFEKYGKHFLGMTGKFHNSWGEFGGFKNKDALKYECADMISIGASMSVGDHLHPLGKIDKSTYAIIGHAFDYADKIEKYSKNTKAYSNIAMWSSHNSNVDIGCSKILQLMHLEYDVLESGDDITGYSCVILPETVRLSNDDKQRILDFVKNGGSLVVSGDSVFDELGIKMIGPSGNDCDYIECEIDEICTPFLSYSSAYKVECDGEVLATLHEPYFNRTGRHFCGHANTPFKAEVADFPALVKKGNIVYFAHSIFEAYNRSGNYVLQKYIKKGIEAVYNKILKVDGLASCGRVRMRKSVEDGFYALHLLYAPPVNRGFVCLLEDFPRIDGIKVSVNVPEKVKSVVSQPDGEDIKFVQNGSELSFTVNNLQVHKLIVINY